MKIYFDGCSRTWGGELENREQERFSSLICKKLDAEEYNISRGGASNERIVRQLLVENDITDYDLAIIQGAICAGVACICFVVIRKPGQLTKEIEVTEQS